MAPNDPNLEALKTRVHQQAQALAESESLAMQNMQYAAELEQQLNSCQAMLNTQNVTDDNISLLQTQLTASKQQLEHLQADVERVVGERDRLRQDFDTAQQRCQQLEQSANKIAKLQSIAATLKVERDELAQKLEQAKTAVANVHSTERTLQQVQQSQAELKDRTQQVTHERDTMAKQLEELQAQLEGGESEQLKAAQRRQEVAEAHHYVLKRQYESLQERVKELEKECTQAHAQAQECDREMAQMERAKIELLDRCDRLEANNQTLQANNQTLQTQLDSLHQETSPTHTTPEPLSVDFVQLENAKQVLQQELVALRAENQALQAQLDEHRDRGSEEKKEATTDEPTDKTFVQSVREATASCDVPPSPSIYDAKLPSIPPLEIMDRTVPSAKNFDRRVFNLAAASAESVTPNNTIVRPKVVELPAFVRRR